MPNTSQSTERMIGGDGASETDGMPIFKSPEAIQKYLGMEGDLEKIRVMSQTAEGKEELLKKIKEANPEINGEADKALEQIQLNAEQLEKKESFLRKMLKLPGKALSSIGNTIKKHPILSAAAAIAAIIALLYFMPTLAPGVGALKDKIITAGKAVLQKIGIGSASVSTEAIASTGVTGTAVSDSAAAIGSSAEEINRYIEQLHNALPQ